MSKVSPGAYRDKWFAVCELLASRGGCLGTHQIDEHTGLGLTQVRNVMSSLRRIGLVTPIERGRYRITELGEKFLAGEHDPIQRGGIRAKVYGAGELLALTARRLDQLTPQATP